MMHLVRKLIGQGNRPLICTPLVGTSRELIVAQLKQALSKQPDVIEWRADFFEGIANAEAVIDIIKEIKESIGDISLIFTIRSKHEGGQPISLTDQEVIELNAAACRETTAEYVDCELRNEPEQIRYLADVAKVSDTRIIGSFHNFRQTPSRAEIIQKLAEAEICKLDVAKVAVMPQTLEDVLTLLSATLEAKNRLSIPLITMAMGKYGMISRMIGGVFGTSLTFAVGAQASAPGQMPIEELQTVLKIVEKIMGEKHD
jgi:3-dehydroquinate dehydratase-1